MTLPGTVVYGKDRHEECVGKGGAEPAGAISCARRPFEGSGKLDAALPGYYISGAGRVVQRCCLFGNLRLMGRPPTGPVV